MCDYSETNGHQLDVSSPKDATNWAMHSPFSLWFVSFT